MLINKANLKDLDVLTRFYVDFKVGHMPFVPEFFVKYRKSTNSFESIKGAVKEMILDKDGLFLAVKENNEIIGFGYGAVRADKRTVFPEIIVGEIKNLWLKQEFRGKGIASKMKNKFFEWFKEKGCNYILIEVLQRNPANKIYENWGFEPYLEKLVKPIE